MRVTISGTPGSGKSTLARMLADAFDLEHVSIGDLRRSLAQDQGMSLAEFNALGEEEEWTDREVDAYQRRYGEEHDDFVMESRLGWYFIDDSFDIYVDADAEERARRMVERDQAGESFASVEEVQESNRERVASDRRRYDEYYGVDPYDEDHYDLVIDSTEKDPEEVLRVCRDALTATFKS